MSRLPVMFTALAALLSAAALGAAPPQARTIPIRSGDDMKFSVTRIDAARGESIRLVLSVTGAIPKAVMAHNVVVLRQGTDVSAFTNASATARPSGYVAPAFSSRILAATPLAGPGETVEVTFKAPVRAGRYDYVCSFPGHYIAGMRGVLVVK